MKYMGTTVAPWTVGMSHSFEYKEDVYKRQSERLLSLDILRGITIVGMILVNNPGTWESIYAPLRHAEWNGQMCIRDR